MDLPSGEDLQVFKIVLDALKLAQSTLKSFNIARLSRKKQKRIKAEAEKIIQAATAEDIDTYVMRPRQKAIEVLLTAPPRGGIGRRVPTRTGAFKKIAPGKKRRPQTRKRRESSTQRSRRGGKR